MHDNDATRESSMSDARHVLSCGDLGVMGSSFKGCFQTTLFALEVVSSCRTSVFLDHC